MSYNVDQSFETFVKDDNGNYSYEIYRPTNLIAGDTDSVYIDLSGVFERGHDIEEVVKAADYIGEYVNDMFPEFMSRVFNVDEDRATVIETERETVSDKSLYIKKKHYSMHIVDDEGQRVDKQKAMGLAIKRTDTQKVVRDFLTELVDMVTDLKSFDEVSKRIDEFQDEFCAMSFQDVGRPMGVKDLVSYEKKYKETGAMHGFPYHIRASIYYNEMCKANDIKIRSGNKIRIVYIKHPEMPYIAVPADAEVLPEFTKDIQVDWRRQWEKVEKKIKAFLEPIGYDRDSRQKALVGDLVEF